VNFDFTDDQHAIKDAAAEFLAERFPLSTVRQLAEAGAYDDALWAEMTELGWAGIFLDEVYGGQGLGLVELMILAEQTGYALAPSPFLSNAAAGLMLTHAGSPAQQQRLLPGIASGQARATVGMPQAQATAETAQGPSTAGVVADEAVPNADGAALVPDADGASAVIVADDDSATLHQPETVEPADSIDPTRPMSQVATADGEPLPGEVGPALDRVRVCVAAELVGLAQRAMEMAVAYAGERQQFGRPVGAYQAVSHRCAQMLLEVEGARSATYQAAWAGDREPATLPLAASMAKAYASDAGRRVTASALQVHGGIGFTWEHDLHFFLKRANADAHLFGDARWHRDRVTELAGLAHSPVPA
jgi:alkylation response protein AidB-like acyl-CoA dehydrogenase